MPDQTVSLHLPLSVIDALIARAGIERQGGKYVLPIEAQPLIGHDSTWAKDEAATWAAIIVATADLSVLA
jgi:hypothetical protein